MLEAVLAGLFGLLIGSFLNVCIYRMPRDLSVVRPRSFCPHCEKPISWFDNVPVVTYLALGGRCRHCRQSISLRYPLVEALTGTLFFIGVLGLGPTVAALKFCVFGAIQVALIFTDFEERILPDEFTLGGTLIGLVFAWLAPLPAGIFDFLLPEGWERWNISLFEAAFTAVFLSGMLWSVGVMYKAVRHKEGMGLGDVKLAACIGAFLGAGGSLMTFVLGSVLGSVCGLLYIWIRRKDAGTYELPFGSFLAIAALAVALRTGPLAGWFGS
jgi:leader peptidase (prepilin peptidase)/N-methyltransferase